MRRYSDFKDKCISFVKGAHERLTVQTLWDAHPASYYHSAAQELISLIKYFLRKHPSVNFLVKCSNLGCEKNETNEYWLHELENTTCPQCKKQLTLIAYDKVNIEWEIDEVNIVIDEFNSDVDAAESIIVTENGHNLTIRLCYFAVVKDRSTRLDEYEVFKEDLNDIVKIFLRDLIEFTAASRSKFTSLSPFVENKWEEIIEKLNKQIDDVFNSMTEKTISSQIMLYHPQWDDKKPGFLFYPYFKLPDEIKDEENPDVTNNQKNLKQDIFSEDMDNFMKESDDSFSSAKENIIKYFNDNASEDMKNGTKKILDIAPKILTYYPNKSNGEGLLEYNFLGEPDTIKIKPLCYQPKGAGPAGKTIESYVTRVFQEIGFEKSLKFNKIKDVAGDDHLPYMLMHMIEFHFGIREGYSGIVTPLMGKGQLIGALITFKKRCRKNGLFFTQSEIELIESLAYRAGKQLMEIKDYKFFTSFRSDYAVCTQDRLIEKLRIKLPYVINCYAVKDEKSNEDEKAVTLKVHNKEIHLYLPNWDKINENDNNCWVLKFNIEEELQIFEEHKIELETFLNYCWAITRAPGYDKNHKKQRTGVQ